MKAERPARSPRRRHERPVVGRAGRPARVVADVMAPGQSVAGDLSVRHLDLAPILEEPGAEERHHRRRARRPARRGAVGSSIRCAATSRSTRRGSSPPATPRSASGRRRDSTARRVAARRRRRGVRRRGDGRRPRDAAGTARQPLAYDLRGRARHVDLRRLPRELEGPAGRDRRQRRLSRRGCPARAGTVSMATCGSSRRRSPGATIAAGSTAARLRSMATQVGYQADATVADLDLQRVGEEFDVPALAADRYKSAINGHVVASGRGTTPQTMDADGARDADRLVDPRRPDSPAGVRRAICRRHGAREGERRVRRISIRRPRAGSRR